MGTGSGGPVDEASMPCGDAAIDELVSAQEQLRQEVWERVRANRVRMRASASKSTLQKFGVGVRYGGRRQQARRAEQAHQHVHGVEGIVWASARRRLSGMSPYADESLAVTAGLL